MASSALLRNTGLGVLGVRGFILRKAANILASVLEKELLLRGRKSGCGLLVLQLLQQVEAPIVGHSTGKSIKALHFEHGQRMESSACSGLSSSLERRLCLA